MTLKLRISFKKFYQSKTPNKYLANFAPFVFENEEHPFMKKLINQVMYFYLKPYITKLKRVRNCASAFCWFNCISRKGVHF